MGDDEYHPMSHEGTNLTEAGGIGYTVVDSIDTMLIMGLQDEYERARQWVAEKLTFEQDANFNTFEVSTRRPLQRPALTRNCADDDPRPGRPALRICPHQ